MPAPRKRTAPLLEAFGVDSVTRIASAGRAAGRVALPMLADNLTDDGTATQSELAIAHPTCAPAR